MMKKNIYMFLSHIGIFQSFLCLLLILSYILDALFPSINFPLRENNCFNLSVISIYFISSFVYIFKYRPMKVENIKRSVEYKKIISLIREFEYTISLTVITSTIYRFLNMLNFLPKIIVENNAGIINLIILIITIRLYFYVVSIIIGLKIWVLLLLIIVAIPLVYLIGVFDIGWWALVSGLMIIWNFINSKDFLTLLNKGEEVSKIPKKLNYIWQRNKVIFYLVTTLIYLVLIISGLFEKDDISVLDRANIRLKTFALFMMALIFVFVIVLSLIYLYSHFDMLKRMVDKRKDNWFFSKLIKVIEFYTYYHKYVIKLNTKKNKRSKSHVKRTFT